MAKDDDGDKKADEGKEGGGGGKKKLILIVAPVLLVVILAAVYFLFLKPSGTEEAAAAPTTGKKTAAAAAAAPAPSSTYLEGAVVKTDAITINLAGSGYLKVALALQATKDAGEEVSAAKALDAAITLFSMKTREELLNREGREKLREKLTERLKTIYEDKVYEVYFTEFVIV